MVAVGFKLVPSVFECKVDCTFVGSESEYPLAVVGNSRDHFWFLDLELVVTEEETVGLIGLGSEPVGDDDVEVDETVEEYVLP